MKDKNTCVPIVQLLAITDQCFSGTWQNSGRGWGRCDLDSGSHFGGMNMLVYRSIGNLILEPATTVMRPLYMYVGHPTVVYRHLLFSSQIAIDSQGRILSGKQHVASRALCLQLLAGRMVPPCQALGYGGTVGIRLFQKMHKRWSFCPSSVGECIQGNAGWWCCLLMCCWDALCRE